MDSNNFNLGQYLKLAFNAPNKYPKKPFLSNPDNISAKKVMTDQDMTRAMRRNVILSGGKINKNGTKS